MSLPVINLTIHFSVRLCISIDNTIPILTIAIYGMNSSEPLFHRNEGMFLGVLWVHRDCMYVNVSKVCDYS